MLWAIGRLPPPSGELSVVELVALMDVEGARVLAFAVRGALWNAGAKLEEYGTNDRIQATLVTHLRTPTTPHLFNRKFRNKAMTSNATTWEVIRLLLPPFLTALAALIAAGLVGHGLAAKWAERQKRREMVLTATNDFYKLYGEFFAVWKLWNYSLQQSGTSNFDERRWKLLERASAAEASMETGMVKLVSERILTADEITMLGCFRQAYQCLRQAIKNGQELNWYFDEYPEYLAFKRLATGVSKLVSTGDQTSPPDITEAQNALRTITSNRWEHTWLAVALAEDKAGNKRGPDD